MDPGCLVVASKVRGLHGEAAASGQAIHTPQHARLAQNLADLALHGGSIPVSGLGVGAPRQVWATCQHVQCNVQSDSCCDAMQFCSLGFKAVPYEPLVSCTGK